MSRIAIGKIRIGGAPRIVASVVSKSVLAEIPPLKVRPFDIAEARLDLFSDLRGWVRLCSAVEAAGVPVLVTIRSSREGGLWVRTQKERLDLYRKAAASVSAIDVEIGSRIFGPACAAAHRKGCAVIGSFHDFKGTPAIERLRRIVRAGRSKGADVVKMAVWIKRNSDVEILRKLLREDSGPLCVIGMGPKGVVTRVALACEGSCLTYGFVDRAAAPGQISCRDLASRLRARGCRPS